LKVRTLANPTEDDLKALGYVIRNGRATRAAKGVMPTAWNSHRSGVSADGGGSASATTRSKYRSKVCYVGDLRFQSLHEAECWLTLQILERAGKITNLNRQVPFELHCGRADGVRLPTATYYADFVWHDLDGARHVADAKSAITRMKEVYRLKKRWMLDEYGISVEEL
jgi:Protein of unknown function (DUF1064)